MEFDSKCFGDDKIRDAVSASSSEYGGESSMNIKDRPCKSDQTVNSNGKTDMLNVRCIQDEYDSESDADGILVDRMENKYVGESNGKFNLPDFGQPQRNIGSVTIQNSAHPMFGNKTFYKGQITINHIVYDADNSNQNEQHANEYAEYEEQTSDDANLIPKESSEYQTHNKKSIVFINSIDESLVVFFPIQHRMKIIRKEEENSEDGLIKIQPQSLFVDAVCS